jgi:hypothetical protein
MECILRSRRGFSMLRDREEGREIRKKEEELIGILLNMYEKKLLFISNNNNFLINYIIDC